MPIADTLEGRIGLTIYSIILTFANVLVILTYFVNRRLRTLANRFVIALAVSDLLVSVILVPLKAWLTNHPVVGPLVAFSLLASLFNICGCTYDRYIAIKNPLHYPTIMTKRRFFQVMAAVWLVPLIIALIPQIWIQNAADLNLTLLDVFIYERRFVAFMTILVLIICFVLVAIYIYIFTVAKRHYEAMKRSESTTVSGDNGDRQARKKKKQSLRNFFLAIKSTMLFATIGASFVFCWLPLIILNLAFAFGGIGSLPLEFLDVAEILMYLNSFLNPVAYAFFQKEFRRTITRLCIKPSTILPTETTFQYKTDYNTAHESKYVAEN